MIIGAIEAVSPEDISGWIHSRSDDLSGALVLAFLDDICIGAGRVELFRQDLADAGLGDGRRGFHFPIALPQPEDAFRVCVRLDRCETFLLQSGAILSNRRAPRQVEEHVAGAIPDQEQRAWLRARGWLQPAMNDLLESIESFGVGAFVRDPEDETGEHSARQLFETILLRPVEMDSIAVPDPMMLRYVVFAPDGPARNAGLLVISAARRLSVMAVENRALPPGQEAMPPDLTGAIAHPVDQRHLLAIRRWVPFDVAPTQGDHGLRVWFPRNAADEPAMREPASPAKAPETLMAGASADGAGPRGRRYGQQRASRSG